MDLKIKVLRLFSSRGATSSPFIQFTNGFVNVESIPVAFMDNNKKTRKLSRYIPYYFSAKRAIQDNKASIIHCHNIYLLPIAVGLKLTSELNVKLILTLHTSYYLLKWRDKLLINSLFVFINELVSCGKSVEDSLPKYIKNSEQSSVIVNAVNITALIDATNSLAVREQKSRSGQQLSKISMYSACRLNAGKNVAANLELAIAMKELKVDIAYHLFGGGSLEAVLKAKYARHEAIIFHGITARTDLYHQLGNMDVFLSLSKGEGFPIAPLEALVLGKLAILSDIPPHRELGSYFPTSVLIANETTTVSAIASFVSDKLKNPTIIDSSLLNYFSIERMEAEYINVYKRSIRLLNQVFSSKSENYDGHYSGSASRYSIEKSERLNTSIEIVSQKIYQKNIVDIGCGTAILFDKLSSMSNSFRYTGIDSAAGMLEIAKDKYAKSCREIEARYFDDIFHVQLEKFDYVLCLGVIGYQINQKDFLESLISLFNRDSGEAIIFTHGNGDSLIRRVMDCIKKIRFPAKLIYCHTPSKIIKDALKSNNLKIVDSQYLLPIVSFLPNKYRGGNQLVQSFYMSRLIELRVRSSISSSSKRS